MIRFEELDLSLEDTEWPLVSIDHDRIIARAVAVDGAGFFYFVRAERNDEFGRATLIETSGGGVEESAVTTSIIIISAG